MSEEKKKKKELSYRKNYFPGSEDENSKENIRLCLAANDRIRPVVESELQSKYQS